MSVFEERIEEYILPRVTKPGRYLGNEINIIKKDSEKVELTVALIFPDLYEMGMSYLGFEILYHILNSHSWLYAERVYAPWVDMEEALRRENLPLFSLETKRPLYNFDVVGFTLQYELHYSNVLNMLDLGGIPLHSEQRGETAPIVLAGGPCAFNPEPLAKFIDAFVIGDGEESFVSVARSIRDGRERKSGRNSLLITLASLPGVYVPKFYEPNDQGLGKTNGSLPDSIKANIVEELKAEYYPPRPLLPLVEVSHDRLSIEIMRGCTRGCRFCNAGTIYRPVRERQVKEIVAQAQHGIASTGYDELSLLSLSTSDYSQLHSLLESLSATFRNKMVNIAFPSLRPEMFTPELARFAKSVRKSGLTFAPEAGTSRLRSAINKTNTNEDLLRAAELAFQQGWMLIKLYFMIGQPTETEEDIEGIVDLISDVVKLGRRYAPARKVNISLSPFVPKAHTPFQWDEQCDEEQIRAKIGVICQRVKAANVNISWTDAKSAILEGIIARGDRLVGDAIERAWQLGAKFDAWSEHFDYSLWQQAFKEVGLDTATYRAARSFSTPLPWDHIEKGVRKDFLISERMKATQGIETSDCKYDECHGCGLMDHKACQELMSGGGGKSVQRAAVKSTVYGRSRKRVSTEARLESASSMRMRYAKKDAARYLSHLDIVRVFERTFTRANIELAYSQGFNPRPKIAYGPALPVGFTSEAEYLDFHYKGSPGSDLTALLAAQLPVGIEVMGLRPLYGKGRSLTSLISRADYIVGFLNESDMQSPALLESKVEALLSRSSISIERQKSSGTVILDIRPYIDKIKVVEDGKKLYITTKMENGMTSRIEELIGALLDVSLEKIPLLKVHRSNLLVESAGNYITPMEV